MRKFILIKKLILFLLLFSSLFFCTTEAHALVIKADHVQVRLISDISQDLTKPFKFAVHYKMDPEWHIYWKNPGDSGAAPKFNIAGGEISSIQWPYPKRIPVSDLTNYGYEDEAVIFLEAKLADDNPQLKLEWLVCKVECIPGFATFDLSEQNIVLAPDLYQDFLKKIPTANSDWEVRFNLWTKSRFSFDLLIPERVQQKNLNSVFIFPKDEEVFLTNAPTINTFSDALSVNMLTSSNAMIDQSLQKFTVVTTMTDQSIESFEVSVNPVSSSRGFFAALVFAFFGGLILNVMPCVLPVLFLKAFSFLSSDNSSKIKHSSWIYTLGVVASFTIIGTLLLTFRFIGASIGWGFQLQNPYVVTFLIVLFFIMGLSFLDIVKFENFLPFGLTRLSTHKYFNNDFGTGVLAVVVASPCTAPFMGTALGATLLLSPFKALSVFVALGLGLALPVPVLAHWPWLINKLPKSGSWMVTFKKILSIPLFLTCLWLTWVLFQQVNFSNLNSMSNTDLWRSFDSNALVEQRKQSDVFVDFTAAWCITCQINKKAVLNTDEIQNLFKKNNVYLMKADWTNYDPKITDALSKFQRNSVPLYIYYRKGSDQAIILPELLTKNDIKNLFNTKQEE